MFACSPSGGWSFPGFVPQPGCGEAAATCLLAALPGCSIQPRVTREAFARKPHKEHFLHRKTRFSVGKCFVELRTKLVASRTYHHKASAIVTVAELGFKRSGVGDLITHSSCHLLRVSTSGLFELRSPLVLPTVSCPGSD